MMSSLLVEVLLDPQLLGVPYNRDLVFYFSTRQISLGINHVQGDLQTMLRTHWTLVWRR